MLLATYFTNGLQSYRWPNSLKVCGSKCGSSVAPLFLSHSFFKMSRDITLAFFWLLFLFLKFSSHHINGDTIFCQVLATCCSCLSCAYEGFFYVFWTFGAINQAFPFREKKNYSPSSFLSLRHSIFEVWSIKTPCFSKYR